MKRVQKCITENCIPTPASCVKWNGGDISYLGICNGEPLTTLIWEIVGKLEDIAGEDLSSFDIDTLTDICNQKAPGEITLLNILNLLKNNQVCLKDFATKLSEQLSDLSNDSRVNINLSCYENFDNVGNSLSITRDELDQLVINELCSVKSRVSTIEGKVINLQEQIDNIEQNVTVEEPSFSTCVDGTEKPTSAQVKAIATAHCSLEEANGNATQITAALSHTPSTDNTNYGSLQGWDLTPDNWAQHYGNLILKVANLESRILFMENNCCAASCDDVKLGFSALFSEDMESILLKFTAGAGTSIPSGFVDKGTTGTIKDTDGNIESFTAVLANNAIIEVPISALNKNGDITVSISVVLGTDTLICQKCVGKTVKIAGCSYCEITATGDSTGSALIIYEETLIN